MKNGDMRSTRKKSGKKKSGKKTAGGKASGKCEPATLQLLLPATSANLGPAFDSAALALRLHLAIQARVAPEFTIVASGRDREICGKLERHLVIETYKEVLQSEGKTPLPLALSVKNQIPIGKGTGSSAAARLAGIALAMHFGDLRWSSERVMEEAARREGHADNIAACWLGGFAVSQWQKAQAQTPNGIPPSGSAGSQSPSLYASKVNVKKSWPLLLVVPQAALPTEESRRVVPTGFSRFQAVANIQAAMLLAAAFAQGDKRLLAHALQDELHQPYRASLCPLLPELSELAGKKGILGVVLSGAGPSVLLLLDSAVPARQTIALVAGHLKARGREAELILTEIERRGASETMKRAASPRRVQGAKR
jgi:homoserine kinase